MSILNETNETRITQSTNHFPDIVNGVIWYMLIDKDGTGNRTKISLQQSKDWFYHVKLGPCWELGNFGARLDDDFWRLSKTIFYSHIQLHERNIGKRIRKDRVDVADNRLRKAVQEYMEAISFETGLPYMKEPQLLRQELRTGR